MIGSKPVIVKKKGEKSIVATTPLDKSSGCKIWRNGERSFPSMRSTSFLAFLNSGRRSGGHCNDLLKVSLVVWGRAARHAVETCVIS